MRGQEGGGSPTTSPEASEGTKVPADPGVSGACGRRRCRTACWSRRRSRAWAPSTAGRSRATTGTSRSSRSRPGRSRSDRTSGGPPCPGRRVRARTLAYVTGSHNVKVGFDHYMNHAIRTWETNNLNLRYRVQQPSAEPDHDVSPAATARTPRCEAARSTRRTSGRVDRFTFQGGLRFDYGSSSVPEQQEGPSRWFPIPIVFPAQDLVTRLPGLQPAGRPGVGRVRHRADVGEGERGQVHRHRAVGRHLHRRQPDARADRRREPARP